MVRSKGNTRNSALAMSASIEPDAAILLRQRAAMNRGISDPGTTTGESAAAALLLLREGGREAEEELKRLRIKVATSEESIKRLQTDLVCTRGELEDYQLALTKSVQKCKSLQGEVSSKSAEKYIAFLREAFAKEKVTANRSVCLAFVSPNATLSRRRTRASRSLMAL